MAARTFFRPGFLAFDERQKRLPAFSAVSARARLFAHQRSVKLVDERIRFLAGFVEQADIGRVANVGRSTRGVRKQTASVGDRRLLLGWLGRCVGVS